MKKLLVACLGMSVLLFSCKKDDVTPPPPDPAHTITGISPATGPKNTVVTITGTGFGTSTTSLKVYFNGVQGTVQTATATSITATVTPGAGTGAVKVEKNGVQVTGPVFTYQGNGWTSTLTLSGAATTLNHPSGIVRDASGNLFVCDRDNHRILKMTEAGVTSIFAGSGTPGLVNGTGTAAAFNEPYCITIDGSGNLYVGDRMNNAIRKITAAGVVTTLAGNGASGSADGTGSAATFAEPLGIGITSAGNLYVADYGNQKIRKITPAGVVTTAVTGYMCFGIAISGSNIYFTNYFQNRVYVVAEGSNTPSLVAGDVAPGNTDGTGAAARFNIPAGITTDGSGNLYITETGNHRIRKITSSNVVTTIAGSTLGNTDGSGTTTQFDGPIAATGDFSNGILYIADFYNNKIRKVIID